MLIERQTLVQEPHMAMARPTKEDCVTIEEAASGLKISKATLYSYMNYLEIQRTKFPFDRKAYVLKSDVERIQRFMAENR